MREIIESILKYWALIVAIVFGVANVTSLFETQRVHAQKIHRLEEMQWDISTIKNDVEWIKKHIKK